MTLLKRTTLDSDTGCWYSPFTLTTHGYAQMTLNHRRVKVHRWYYAQTFGEIPEGHHIHHSCGVKRCVNPEHLILMPQTNHARLHAPKGPIGKPRKLTDDDVRAIRVARAGGVLVRDLAERYGVCESHIQMVAHGYPWHWSSLVQ